MCIFRVNRSPISFKGKCSVLICECLNILTILSCMLLCDRGLLSLTMRPFQLSVYKSLTSSFSKVCRSISELNRSVKALNDVMTEMLEQDGPRIKVYVQLMAHQSLHLFAVSDRALKAIRLSSQSLQEYV